MDQLILEGNWNEIKGKLCQRWGQLTNHRSWRQLPQEAKSEDDRFSLVLDDMFAHYERCPRITKGSLQWFDSACCSS
jgi:hypothetical protein